MSEIKKEKSALAETIRARREEWEMEIEEAAMFAGVEPDVWEKYETDGTVLTKEDCEGICRALHWLYLSTDGKKPEGWFDVEEMQKRDTWSKDIECRFGQAEALSLAVGLSMLKDRLNVTIEKMSKMPKGTHIGELDYEQDDDLLLCELTDYLPQQFLMRYDYDFLISMKNVLLHLCEKIQADDTIFAHSVMEELIIKVAVDLSADLIQDIGIPVQENFNEWYYDLFDDCDIDMFLFDDSHPAYIGEEDRDWPYHFDNWTKKIFYTGM